MHLVIGWGSWAGRGEGHREGRGTLAAGISPMNTKLVVSIVGAAAAVGTLLFTIITTHQKTQIPMEIPQEDIAAVEDVVKEMATESLREDVAAVQRAHPSSSSGMEIEFEGHKIGAIDGLSLEPAHDDSSSFLVRLTASFPAFTNTLDRMLREQGNFGSCSQRLCWAGQSSIRRYGASLAMSSRVRYEQWVCGFLGDHRIFRDTKTVDWRISVEPAPLDRLQLIAQVDNINSLQNDLELLLGLRVREVIKIPLPAYCGSCECAEIVDILGTAVESTRFSRASAGNVRVDVTFSLASDLSDALGCLQ